MALSGVPRDPAAGDHVQRPDGHLRGFTVQHLELRSNPKRSLRLVEAKEKWRSTAHREPVGHAHLDERHHVPEHAERHLAPRERASRRGEEEARQVRIVATELPLLESSVGLLHGDDVAAANRDRGAGRRAKHDLVVVFSFDGSVNSRSVPQHEFRQGDGCRSWDPRHVLGVHRDSSECGARRDEGEDDLHARTVAAGAVRSREARLKNAESAGARGESAQGP
jgi:hypothetical protein